MKSTLNRDIQIFVMWERKHIHRKAIAYRKHLSYDAVRKAIYRVRGKDRRSVPRTSADRRAVA